MKRGIEWLLRSGALKPFHRDLPLVSQYDLWAGMLSIFISMRAMENVLARFTRRPHLSWMCYTNQLNFPHRFTTLMVVLFRPH